MKMERTAYSELLAWKSSKNRKPLILYGARQVGKTWLLKEFGKNEYKTAIYINFDKEPDAQKYFTGSISPNYIIAGLEDYSQKKIVPGETIIIFDEIQENQRAKDSLKYFNEDAPQYHIAAAGSFLGIAGGKFPIGQVDEITIRPMSFYEFLQARGDDILLNNIKSLDRALFDLNSITAGPKLKEYMYVGGMPAVVKAFIESGNLHEARKEQAKILNNYKEDFSKHIKGTDIPKVRMIWDTIPLHLAKEKKKFMYKEIRTGARAAAYENALDWLVNTGLVYKVDRTNEATACCRVCRPRGLQNIYA